LINGSANNMVGGTTPANRNLISGNTGTGILIESAGSAGNVVAGNYIGTDITGTDAIANHAGIGISFSNGGNTIGGTAVGARNIISGNFDGVVIALEVLDVVVGNYIGTDATGTDALGNVGTGVLLFGGSRNTVGGTTAASRNVISGNGVGIDIL
jgi:hypothetical protein